MDDRPALSSMPGKVALGSFARTFELDQLAEDGGQRVLPGVLDRLQLVSCYTQAMNDQPTGSPGHGWSYGQGAGWWYDYDSRQPSIPQLERSLIWITQRARDGSGMGPGVQCPSPIHQDTASPIVGDPAWV